MSLSRRLDLPQVRAAATGAIRNPGFVVGPIRAPLLAENPARVGVAFDYALRFCLHARGWADEPDTVAASAVAVLLNHAELGVQPGIARGVLDDALGALASRPAGQFDSAAANACYLLAGLDVVRRARRVDQIGRPATDAETEDLLALLAIVPWDAFRPTTRLLLNPTFGEGSRAVGGADADLVLDDVVIELKVISKTTIPVEAVRQVVGYALLARRYGVDGDPSNLGIHRIGLYHARSGTLSILPLVQAISPDAEAGMLGTIIDAEDV